MPLSRRLCLVLLVLVWGAGPSTALARPGLAAVDAPSLARVLADAAAGHDDADHADDPHHDPAEGDHADHDHADHDHADHDYADHDHAAEHHEHADGEHAEHEHGDDHHDHAAHDHGHAGVAGTRLLVAEAGGARLLVLDVATGRELARFGTPGPGTVHQLPDPQLAVVVHRDENRVTFVHSGLTAIDHGDHADLVEGNPYVLQTLNVGLRPTHVFAQGDDLAFFNDGDGTVAWLDRRLLGVSLDYAVLDGRGPDHGAVAIVDDHAFVG